MMNNKYNENENISCILFSSNTQNYFIAIFYDLKILSLFLYYIIPKSLNYTIKLLKICISFLY